MQPRLPLTSWEHLFIDVTKEDDRYLALHAYLKTCVRPGERVIIFRTHGPKAVQVALTLRALEHNAAPVVGRMTESDRNKTLKLFSDGTIPILVCTEVSIANGVNIPRADHLLNWGFHWSSAQANSREYIARCDKGNGRIVSFVTIADSVTLQHLHTSLGFHMKEVQFDDATKKEALEKLNEGNFPSRQEFVRSREQDKLNVLLASSTSSSSSSSINTNNNNNTSSSLNNTTSASSMGNRNGSTNSNNNNNNWLPSRHYVPPTPGEAMKNITQVMNQYQAIHNGSSPVASSSSKINSSKTKNRKNNNHDDDTSSSSDEDDDDEYTSSSSEEDDTDDDDDDESTEEDGSDNESSNDSKSGQNTNNSNTKKNKSSFKKNKNKKNKKSPFIVPTAGPIVQRGDVGLVVSPTRARSVTDNHGLHGHVTLPKYSYQQQQQQNTSSSSPLNSNNHNNTRSVSRGGAASSSVTEKRSMSRPRQQQQQQNNNNLCLPRQVDDRGKFVVNQKQAAGPFAARPGDEELVQMIEAEMNLGHLTTKFEDIAGQDEAKHLLEEAVIFPTLMPNFFTEIRRPWKGVLLYGPPGTGKTLLAKAVATSARTCFFAVSPATLTSKWRGESEKLLRVLFEMARHYAPSTIFIDECDSLCSERGGSQHEASLRAKSMLLQLMDGLCANQDQTVVVIGATNHPASIDSAFLRRFEQRIYIPLPTQADRECLFRLNTKSILLADDVQIPKLASMLDGKLYSGADITTLIRDAAMRPMRRFFYGENNNNNNGENANKSNNTEQAEANRRRQELYRNPQQLEEKLAKLPVLMSDFEASIKHLPSSVSKEQIAGFEEWRRKYASQ